MSHVDEILDAMRKDADVILIRAPPGSGKTWAAIKYAIENAFRDKKVAIFFRTRMEVSNAMRLAIEKENLVGFIPVVGKEFYCVKEEKIEFSRYHCFLKNCDLIYAHVRGFIEECMARRPKSLEELKSIIMKSIVPICPYHEIMRSARSSPIVFATYPFFIHNDLYERLGKRDILILDEAHTLAFPNIDWIPFSTYRMGYTYVRRRGENPDPREVATLIQREPALGRSIARYINWVSKPGITIQKEGFFGKVVIPIRLIRKRLENCEKIILMSSTLWPIRLFEILFGKGLRIHKLVIRGLGGTKNRRIYGISCGLTSAFVSRSSQTYKSYANIVKLFMKSGKPTIVFTPSKEFGLRLCRILGIEFEEETNNILITVARGKYAEGIEVPMKEEPRIALILGLPYPKPDEDFKLLCKVYSKFYGIDVKQMFDLMMEASMVSALFQAAGRVGRQRKGIVFVVDERVKKLKIPMINLNTALKLAKMI